MNSAKLLRRRLIGLRSLYDHGPYRVRLFDGFEQPFNVGFSLWREPLDSAYVSFDNHPQQPITSIVLQFINHQIEPASVVPAHLEFSINDQKLPTAVTIPIGKESEVKLDLSQTQFKNKNNILIIDKSFVSTTSAYLRNKQVVFLQILRINDQPQPIHTLDYPYVSPISQRLFDAKYQYYGNEKTDRWAIWHMHSGIFERTFDFWWLRPFHYWDLPKKLFAVLLAIDFFGIAYFGWLTKRFSPRQ